MIQSMTGFGKAVVSLPSKKLTIELKSLNSKSIDLHTYIPQEYRAQELVLRKLISDALTRGKINFSIHIENAKGQTSVSINHEVVQAYIKELKAISESDKNDLEFLKMAMTMPETLSTKNEVVDDQEYKTLKLGVKEALKSINQYRSDEGKALEKDFRLRLKILTALLDEVAKIDSDRIEKRRERLQKAIEELQVEVDENRFEQELVYYIEKFDITEEKTRLKNHLDYFYETLDAETSEGKKLKFIAQEMGREINTIGSKSNDAPMQKLVVQMKDELEKIKEQVLNVL